MIDLRTHEFDGCDCCTGDCTAFCTNCNALELAEMADA